MGLAVELADELQKTILADANYVQRCALAFNCSLNEVRYHPQRRRLTRKTGEIFDRYLADNESSPGEIELIAHAHDALNITPGLLVEAFWRVEQTAQGKNAPAHFFRHLHHFLIQVIQLQTEKLEQQSQQAQWWQKAFFFSTSEGMLICEVDNGQILWCNQAFANLLGYTPAEIMKRSWQSITPSFMAEQEEAELEQRTQRVLRGELVAFEKDFIHREGSLLPFLLSFNVADGAPFQREQVYVATCTSLSLVKQKEREIQKQAEHWQGIFEALTEGVAVISRTADQGGLAIVEANHALCAMLGYQRDEILNRNDFFSRLSPWGSADDRMNHCIEAEQQDKPVHYEQRIVRKDQSSLQLLITLQTFAHEHQLIATLVNVSDLASLKEKEQRLREQRSYWRGIFDGAGQGMLVAQIERDRSVLMEINPALCSLLDFGAEECMSMANDFLGGLLSKDMPETKRNLIKQALGQNREQQFKATLVRKDGSGVPVLLTISPLYREGWVVVTASNLERIIAKEEELRRFNTLATDLLSQLAWGHIMPSTVEAQGAAGDLRDLFNHTVDELARTLSVTQTNIEETSQISEELLMQQNVLEQASNAIADIFKNAQNSIEQFSHGLSSTNQNVQTASDFVNKIKYKTRVTSEAVVKVADSITISAEETRKTLMLSETMREFAFQTNILALNASIEAANASEHGLGFSVLAKEIRVLANCSGLQAKQAENLLNSIIERANNEHLAIQDSVEAIRSIEKAVTEANERLTDIADNAQRQDDTVKEIAQTVSRLGARVEESAHYSEQIGSVARRLSGKAQQVEVSLASFQFSRSEGEEKVFGRPKLEHVHKRGAKESLNKS